jgi:hypothetical protein
MKTQNYYMPKLISFSFLLAILFYYKQPALIHKEVIEGTVISEKTHKPVSNAHVYIVHGEEEALTNSKGQFRIETIQKFPLVITVDQQDHGKKRLTISTPEKLVISISPKI